MELKKLGNTGIKVSPIGLGTVKLGRNQAVKYPEPFEIPDDKQALNLLHFAKELGINTIDTAPAYGNSEERLGKFLKSDRHDWVIITKTGEEFDQGESTYHFTPEHTEMSIKRSLARLNTDYLDIVLVHSDGNDVYNIQHYGILDCLNNLKKQGHIRSFGVSTKTVEGGILAVEQSDMVMVTYNPIHTEEQPVISRAFQLNKGVLIKKALASGHIQKFPSMDPVVTSLKFIFCEPGVHSVIVGTLNHDHLAQNVAAVK